MTKSLPKSASTLGSGRIWLESISNIFSRNLAPRLRIAGQSALYVKYALDQRTLQVQQTTCSLLQYPG